VSVRRPPRLPPRLAAALGAALLLWTAAVFAVASVRFVDRLLGPPRAVGATGWNPGEYGPGRLEELLAAVEPRVPPGEVVLVSAAPAPAEEEMFVSLWAAYYLPRHRVIRARHPAAAQGRWLVAFGAEASPPGGAAEELLRHPSGALYRLPPGGL
jgi:hypothetical protein